MSFDQAQTSSAKTTRFFIALIPPPDVQAEATKLKEYFRDRYRSKAALKSPPHITLQAPFKWLDEDRDRLIATLAQFQCPFTCIPITLSGFGAFPPRVIYMDVQHTPELMTLQTELSSYLAETLNIVDPRSQTRPFRPHLTIAFRDLKPVSFRRAWPEFEHQEIHYTFKVQDLTLLRHTGQKWVSHQQFSLDLQDLSKEPTPDIE
ncbi:2'-5' RNA ligase family protein [Oscillatoria sp. CS-180]|uniref:2'-5' RNA ligase family protein n=1 Tax=Oscillatoria sp. CS-180 TaxID=3021720 RepID=UPI0023304E43|nr:2'-5' RNA ligase family protein [Oscillatoria sp. CS-180]MDB9527831.1 2'-5' RNA ligase family protein [Oscillatoria sp. CS-180]